MKTGTACKTNYAILTKKKSLEPNGKPTKTKEKRRKKKNKRRRKEEKKWKSKKKCQRKRIYLVIPILTAVKHF